MSEALEEEEKDVVAPLNVTTTPSSRIAGIFPELREKSEEKKIRRSIVFSSLASKKNLWEAKTSSFRDRQAINVFSGSYDKDRTEHIQPDQYGKAPEGSRTEERALEANQWVENEITKLVNVIKSIGEDGGGNISVTFGTLFDAYTDISDTLVGILMRAKKRNILDYPGQMLYQGASAHVRITLM